MSLESSTHEEWKTVKGYEDYEVSNRGNVRSNKSYHTKTKGMFLKPRDNGTGYLTVCLWKGNKRKNHYVHRLVAEAFIENPNNLPQVNHRDYDRHNNDVTNLEWLTRLDNTRYSIGRGRHPRKHNHTTTGYQYICKRGNKYRVTIWHKLDKQAKTLEEAIAIRDKAMKELNYYYE